MTKWKPISSCPKNQWVLFGEWCGRLVIAKIDETGSISDERDTYDDEGLTHWQPLPEEPPFLRNKKKIMRPIGRR